MSSYAILGATGQTGNAILQILTAQDPPPSSINVLVRSRAKLERMTPSIAGDSSSSNKKRIHVYEGTITDTALLTACIRGTTAVFLTVATPDNKPYVRIAREQAEAVVTALETLRGGGTESEAEEEANEAKEEKKQQTLPTLVMLSSSETEERLVQGIPWPVRKMLFLANYWVYTDLIAAEKYLRDRAEWIDAVYFKPGGISHDIQRGHALSTDTSMTFVSFLDVAAGMVECAEDGKAWSGKSVSVLSRGKAKIPLESMVLLTRNMLGTFFPTLYQWLF